MATKDHLSVEKDGIRLLAPEKLEQATALQEDCSEFLSKTKQFHGIVSDFMQVMEAKQAVIDAQKLRTIGLGNKVLGQEEVRKRKQRELQATVFERRAELERLKAQRDSLARVDQEQRALIERLQNNEA
ncbi:intraflagellar transport protein 20 [Pavlovales sp. CCMP2436]|nr:intraflagellar transport protein 20 [Pavlovales sp. CCMP2436]|mmetsp:Transcript_3920/g.9952  ORF Transcript_3920/g.9952 Transcript_3920/m.9952 type:complete len:129 (-) Transcript_3920:427-813(-)